MARFSSRIAIEKCSTCGKAAPHGEVWEFTSDHPNPPAVFLSAFLAGQPVWHCHDCRAVKGDVNQAMRPTP